MVAQDEFGGAESDYLSYVPAAIEIAAVDGALSTIVSIHSIMVAGFLRDGPGARKDRFLPDLVAGRCIGAFDLTETGAGSDGSAILTRMSGSGLSTQLVSTVGMRR